jgi:hypothetical protein
MGGLSPIGRAPLACCRSPAERAPPLRCSGGGDIATDAGPVVIPQIPGLKGKPGFSRGILGTLLKTFSRPSPVNLPVQAHLQFTVADILSRSIHAY